MLVVVPGRTAAAKPSKAAPAPLTTVAQASPTWTAMIIWVPGAALAMATCCAASSAQSAMTAEEVRYVLDALDAARRAQAMAMATAETCCAESMACAATMETAQAATAARAAAAV